MRPSFNLRKVRRVYAGVGALLLTVPATAVALTAGSMSSTNAPGAAPPTGSPDATVTASHIAYGDEVTMIGKVADPTVGSTIALEFASSGSSAWHPLASAKLPASGQFRLAAALRRSGRVRARGDTGSSSPQPVAVAAGIRAPARPIDALAGQTIHVRGTLLPAIAGRQVRLQGRDGADWQTLATARMGRRGGFDLHLEATRLGEQAMRVRFPGDRYNDRAGQSTGRLTVYRQSLASWYQDGGATACGFHAGYGVANKSLPCGARVRFRSGGRSVTAVVDDRGPFVGGREWDFNQNTAAALGFDGVGTIWSSQ